MSTSIMSLYWILFSTLTTPTTENVSFQSISELSQTPAHHRISYGSHPLQQGDLWVGNPDQPLLLIIHGGCWLRAFGADHLAPMASDLHQQGYSVWTPGYRRTGEDGGGWPGTFQDIKAALNHVPQLPKTVNTAQIILMGHSAGGHLALLASHEKPVQNVALTIGLAAITDLPTYAQGSNGCQKSAVGFMGGTPAELADAYQQADPQQKGTYQNTLLLQGAADTIVPSSQAQLPGAAVTLVPGAGHFDWIHPKTNAYQTLLAALKTVK